LIIPHSEFWPSGMLRADAGFGLSPLGDLISSAQII